MYNAYRVGVGFSYEYAVTTVDNSTFLVAAKAAE